MKNNYSIFQRNQLVEEHLWCIDTVLEQNRSALRAVRLEYDDVYQELALRLIEAVENFDPELGKLEQQIFARLRLALYGCKACSQRHGITGLPGHRRSTIVSLNALVEAAA